MKNKKNLIVSFIVLCAVWALIPQTVLAARTLKVRESYTAYAGYPNPSYPPSGGMNISYVWYSDNSSLVEVSGSRSTAQVTAMSAGSTYIGCKAYLSYESYDRILKRNIPRYESETVYLEQVTVEKPAQPPINTACTHSNSDKKAVSTPQKADRLKDGKQILQCKICKKETIVTIPGYDRVEMYCNGKFRDEAQDKSVCAYGYTGKTIKPAIRVLDRHGKSLKRGTDYSLTYPKNAKAPGYYSVLITFKGNYCKAIYKRHFWIRPKTPPITGLKAKKKGITVTWRKPAYSTGYEIRYSTDKKFPKKATHIIHIKNGNTKIRTISKLGGNQKYYIQIRCYYKSRNRKSYSSWSGTKSIITKR